MSQPYLSHISAISLPHLCHISDTFQPHLWHVSAKKYIKVLYLRKALSLSKVCNISKVSNLWNLSPHSNKVSFLFLIPQTVLPTQPASQIVGTRTRVMILYSYEISNHCMKHCCRTYLLEYYPHMLPHHHHTLHCTTPCLAPARTPRTPPDIAYRRVRILWLLNVLNSAFR